MRSNSPRRKNRSSSTGLTYDSLESRCVLTGAHQLPLALPEGLNLIQNEAFDTKHESETGLYNAQNIIGWQPIQSNANSSGQIQLESFPGRGRVLHLDASDGLDQVYQDIRTEPGKRYLISFDSRPSSQVYQNNHSVFSTRFDVLWNGTKIGTIQPRYHWKTNTFEVIGGNGDLSRLTFSEPLVDSTDRVGALISCVRVVKAVESSINNGGFEQLTASALPVTGYSFSNGSVPGWNAASPVATASMTLEPARPHLKTEQGERLINLNSHQGHVGFRDAISQNLNTVPGAIYYVRFLAQGDALTELRIRWDNSLALIAYPDTKWESVGLLVRASSSLTNLTFIEGSDSNRDVRMDSIKIYRVDSEAFAARPDQPQASSANFSQYAAYVDEAALKKRKVTN